VGGYCAGAGPRPHDGFAGATVLTGTLPIVATGTNVDATKEAGEPNHGGEPGGKSVWWTWTAPAGLPIRVVVTTAGSSAGASPLDTTLGVYTGSSVGTLQAVASDDDAGRLQTSYVNFVAQPGTTYRIAVDGFDAAAGQIRLDLHVEARPVRDFDRNGRDDILWRDAGNGETYLWKMDGTEVVGGGYTDGHGTPDWDVVALADFNADKRSDILWRHRATGQTYLWLMDGTGRVGAGFTDAHGTPDWRIVGTCDFDGDSFADILWRHSSSGDTYLWMMNGASAVRRGYTSNHGSPDWEIHGLGDFDGDGRCDILWRHFGGATRVWLMNGTQAVENGPSAPWATSAWSVAAIGDLNGDGRADILWRRPDSAGSSFDRLFLWMMKGRNLVGSYHLPRVTSDWLVVGAADFNGDGKSDILWRNRDNDETYVWMMDGGTMLGDSGYTAAQASRPWAPVMPRQ
jgi:hypothetical protein